MKTHENRLRLKARSGVVVESKRVNEWNFVAFCSRSSTKHKTKMCIAKTFYVWKIRRGASRILRTSPWIHSQLQLCVGCAVGWMVLVVPSILHSFIRLHNVIFIYIFFILQLFLRSIQQQLTLTTLCIYMWCDDYSFLQ